MELLAESMHLRLSGLATNFYAMDELTRGLCEVTRTGRIEVWLSFATSCLSCIHNSMVAKMAFEDIQQVGKHIAETMSTHFQYSSQLKRIPRIWAKQWPEYAKDFATKNELFLCKNMLFHWKEAFCKGNKLKFSSESERFYLLKRQPILCGMLAFRATLDLHWLGLAVVNTPPPINRPTFCRMANDRRIDLDAY